MIQSLSRRISTPKPKGRMCMICQETTILNIRSSWRTLGKFTLASVDSSRKLQIKTSPSKLTLENFLVCLDQMVLERRLWSSNWLEYTPRLMATHGSEGTAFRRKWTWSSCRLESALSSIFCGTSWLLKSTSCSMPGWKELLLVTKKRWLRRLLKMSSSWTNDKSKYKSYPWAWEDVCLSQSASSLAPRSSSWMSQQLAWTQRREDSFGTSFKTARRKATEPWCWRLTRWKKQTSSATASA